jgi:phosphoglycolate phosphatase-like HAD superfamily hydrolase
MTRPTVLLFDIDGTLITSGGGSRRALEAGVAAYLGLESFEAVFWFGGLTDRGIMRGALKQAGAEASETRIDEVIAFYLERLPDVLSESGVYRTHEGVHEILDAVTDADHCAVGLGTGNLEVGARLKLDAVGLNPYFSFGGFGCDAEPRDQLILAGAKRGAAALDLALDECRVVIIGDTIRDVDAAHANGFECVAVSTGGVSHERLAQTKTEILVASLTEQAALDWLLG